MTIAKSTPPAALSPADPATAPPVASSVAPPIDPNLPSPLSLPDHTQLPESDDIDPSLPSLPPLPDHTQLPESDGTFVKNFQEHPQSILLTSSIIPALDQLHPDGQYVIGQDCGIYWRIVEPAAKGAEAPDWFYVPGVPPLLKGKRRRSYVTWKEFVVPLIAIEFVSGNGDEERDATAPKTSDDLKAGKFWVYEQALRIPFYAIYEVDKASVEVYELVASRYRKCQPNGRGHYPIAPMGVELGIWHGNYAHQNLPWLRWWDSEGNLLLAGEERAEQEKLRAEQEKLRAEQEKLRAEQEKLRAEQEKLRADVAQDQVRSIIQNLLASGMSLEQVSQVTGRSLQDLAEMEDNSR